MQIKALVGAGDRIAMLTLPFALGGLAANLAWPWAFRMGLGTGGRIVGAAFLALGVPLWLTSVVQILAFVPREKLITGGPFALMLHPLYTSVAPMVLPGLGLLFDSWLGFVVGTALHVSTRLFAPSEERDLAARFGEQYARYRRRVILPWL